MKLLDLTGQRFGRLTVEARDGIAVSPNGQTRPTWLCRCDCGQTVTVFGENLRNGRTKSCGCYQRQRISERSLRHGHARRSIDRQGQRSPEYRAWCAAKNRCNNHCDKNYPRYGGRGIRMSNEWANSFEAFLRDMGSRPDGCTLDRIENNGNYEAGNCRWATQVTQNQNRRSNRYVMLNGERVVVTEASRRSGLSRYLIDQALLTPS